MISQCGDLLQSPLPFISCMLRTMAIVRCNDCQRSHKSHGDIINLHEDLVKGHDSP